MWLQNDWIQVGVAPRLGGRILSVQVAGHEFLYRNRRSADAQFRPIRQERLPNPNRLFADYPNYGGDKTWLAPQGWSGDDEWAGPPGALLDAADYTIDRPCNDPLSLTMISPPDPVTGMRLERKLCLAPDAPAYDLIIRGVNHSRRTVRWSLWNLTQFPGGPSAETFVFMDTLDFEMESLFEVDGRVGVQRRPGMAVVPPQDSIGKVGFPSASGLVIYSGSAGLVRMQTSFSTQPRENYPDRGSRVQVWLESPRARPMANLGGAQFRDSVVECEFLSPTTELLPQESVQMRIRFMFGLKVHA